MNKIIYILFLAFFFQGAFASDFKVKYYQHIDVYNFLENLSGWSHGHVLKSYSNVLEKQNLTQKNDSFHLNNLNKIRIKYYKLPASNFFSENDSKEDVIKMSFFKSKTYKEAYINLSNFLSNQELKEFDDCYKHFLPRMMMLISKEGPHLGLLEKLDGLNGKKEIIDYLDIVKRFYTSAQSLKPIPVYLVWQPEGDESISYYINKNIILSVKSRDLLNDLNEKRTAELSSILLHEMMHYYSSMMDEKLKLKLSSMLIDSLRLNQSETFDLGQIIEEPLAVILGQQLFYKKLRNKYYNPYDNVYHNQWIKLMALSSFPLVEHYIYYKLPMDEAFINQYANLSIMALEAKNVLFMKKI